MKMLMITLNLMQCTGWNDPH